MFLDVSDLETAELALVRLEERKPHLIHALRVQVLHVFALVGTVEEDTEEIVVSLHDVLDDVRTVDELDVDLERAGDEHLVADAVPVVRRVDLLDGGGLRSSGDGRGGHSAWETLMILQM